MKNTEINKDFCIFILTHGRPDHVITFNTLKKAGCTYPIYFIIDNEDKTADKYYKNFGRENVIMFDKLAISKTFDTGDNFDNRKCIVYARNACFDIAKELGYTYFLELDDDYENFRYKFNENREFGCFILHKGLDKIFKVVLNYYKSINAKTISFSQGGDYIGGGSGQSGTAIRIKRKAMNTFFCSIRRPFNFIGRINEDVNTYVRNGSKGDLIFQINNFAVWQADTQSSLGGMTETYTDGGTYLKSFYTVMYSPSCTTIGLMGTVNPKLHHKIHWNNAVPKIVSEDLKKL